jgi:ClpA/ClpB-like protein
MEAAMTGHMTADAIAIGMRAYENAIRLGHPYLGGEHFLLALAAAVQPAGAVLREHGATPGRVEAENRRSRRRWPVR